VSALAVGALVLALRGELGPYLSTQWANIDYSATVLEGTGRPGGVLGHLRVVRDFVDHPTLTALLSVVVAVGAVATLARGPRDRAPDRQALAALTLAALVSAFLTLALTAAWDHHLQLLAWPGWLMVAFSTAWLEDLPPLAVRLPACALGAAATLALFGGPTRSWTTQVPLSSWWTTARSPTADALKDPRFEALRRDGQTTYAHLGMNDEEGHAAFLPARFDLACPRFHQYTFSPYLDDVLACIRRERPLLIVATASFAPRFEPRATAWNHFVADGRALLRRHYVLASRRNDLFGKQLDVWRLRTVRPR
jgi:hypothetical protein